MTLRDLRVQAGKSLKEIASELKVTVRTVSRYEEGIRTIDIIQVLSLAKLYDCTAEEVIQAQLNSCR